MLFPFFRLKKWHELQAVTSLSQKRDRMEGSNLKLKVIAISHSKRGRIKKNMKAIVKELLNYYFGVSSKVCNKRDILEISLS